jgi:hypothetical protein
VAVATRFQVIEKESPENSLPSSHHIERNKSRTVGRALLPVRFTETLASFFDRTGGLRSRVKLRVGIENPSENRFSLTFVEDLRAISYLG